jgi:hypothetical protein
MNELEILRSENDRLQEMVLRLEERPTDAVSWVRDLFECNACYEPATGVRIPEGAEDNGKRSLDASLTCADHGGDLYRSFESLATTRVHTSKGESNV